MHSKGKNGKWYVKTAIHSNKLLQDKNECLVCTKGEQNKKYEQKTHCQTHEPHGIEVCLYDKDQVSTKDPTLATERAS